LTALTFCHCPLSALGQKVRELRLLLQTKSRKSEGTSNKTDLQRWDWATGKIF
jgi:hypothetical protein